MTQRLHLVFGGELVDPTGSEFKDVGSVHIVGLFGDYAAAFDAWKGAAQMSVDNAHMRYFIADIPGLRAAEPAAEPADGHPADPAH